MTGNQHTPEPAQQATPLTLLVVASDPKLLKLLRMAFSLEFACEVLTVQSARSAREAAKRSRPALLVLDEQFLNGQAHDLGACLHRIAGLEQMPTLFLNAVVPFQNDPQGYPIRFLEPFWKVEALYAAVRALLGQAP